MKKESKQASTGYCSIVLHNTQRVGGRRYSDSRRIERNAGGGRVTCDTTAKLGLYARMRS